MQITNEIMEAADAVKVSGRAFKAVVLMGEVLEKIGNLQQTASQAEQRLAVAEAAFKETEAKHQAALSDLEKVKEAHQHIDAHVKNVHDAAKVKAEEKAADIVAGANAQAEVILEQARKQVGAIHGDIDVAAAQLAEVHSDIKRAQGTHNDLLGKIEKTKGDLRALIGG